MYDNGVLNTTSDLFKESTQKHKSKKFKDQDKKSNSNISGFSRININAK
jgi:hypothetical protein